MGRFTWAPQQLVAEARAALRSLGPELVLVAPAGEVWTDAASTLGAAGGPTIPLVDLCSALSARDRIALARRVLTAARGTEPIGVIEAVDVPSPVPDLPVRAELPRLGARIRVGRRDLRYLAQRIAKTGTHACMALEISGERAAGVLRDALASSLGAESFDLRPESWAILGILEQSNLDVTPFLELARHASPELAGELEFRIGVTRWDDFVRHQLRAIAAADDPASEARIWDLLWHVIPENPAFALPEGARPLLLRALRAGVDPARTASLLLMHGWDADEAIAALTPLVEKQLAGYQGDYDDEIEVSSVVWAIGRGGVSNGTAIRLLALIDRHASGNLLGSLARALSAVGGAEAKRLIASQVERQRRELASPRRSDDEFRAGILARLEIELAKLDGIDGGALFREMWSRDAGLFADHALIDELPWILKAARDDVFAALRGALSGGRVECVRAQPFLRALGDLAKPLAPSIRAACEGLFEAERLDLLWTVTGEREAARELIGREGALHQLTLGTGLFDIAATDALSDDAAIREPSLDALRRLAGEEYADPLWLCFYAALQQLRDAGASATSSD